MPPKKRLTRDANNSTGAPAPLPDLGALNDTSDVVAAMKYETIKENPNRASSKVAEQLETKFKKINPKLPLLSKAVISTRLLRLHKTDKKFQQNQITSYQSKIYLKKLSQLFDIISCQCKIKPCLTECPSPKTCTGFHVRCSCLLESRIPDQEVTFVKDQREKIGTKGGQQTMSGIDVKEAKAVQKEKKSKDKKLKEVEDVNANIEEKKKEQAREHKRVREAFKDEIEEGEVDDNKRDRESDADEDFDDIKKLKRNMSNRNTVNMGPFAAEVCRYSVSDRAAAALWNAAVKCLTDATLMTFEDNGEVDDLVKTDKNKIRREKRKFAVKEKARVDEEISSSGIECIGTDGKRNKKTLKKTMHIVDGEEVEKVTKGTEEHIAYTKEPGGEYITHSTVTDGTGRGLAEDARDVVAEINATKSLLAVLLDGTSVNTGWKEGLVAHLERMLDRKLLMLSCMLHANELPLRHLFTSCDGGHGTSGPESFAGPIGQAVKGPIHLLDLATFTPINTSLPDLPDTVWQNLSRDQKLLYRFEQLLISPVPSYLDSNIS